MLVSVFTLVSCLKTETVSSSECAITAFSVGDIKTGVTVYKSDGKDTVITKTITGSTIKFNIDQVNGIITTVDSVANWISLEKVCPTFTANGKVYAQFEDGIYYQLTSGSDSLDFSKPINVTSVGYDGISAKKYVVSIKKSAYSTDTLVWNKESYKFSVNTDFKTFYYKNQVCATFKDADGKVKMTTSTGNENLSTWSEPKVIEGADIDYQSVTVYKDNLYAMGTDGLLYKIEDYVSTKIYDFPSGRILTADDQYFYVTEGEDIMSTEGFGIWTKVKNADSDMLPTKCINSFCYTSRSNSNIIISMMNGITDDNTAVSWYKVTSPDYETNQKWMYIQVTDDNPYSLPKFKHMSSCMLNGSLFAIGIEDESNAYKYIYRSDDNGITWKNYDKYPLPVELSAADGMAELVAFNDKLWIIQKGGKVWSGVIR